MVSLVATCGECGFENPKGWVSCSRCGTLLGPLLRGKTPQVVEGLTHTTRRAPMPDGLSSGHDGNAETTLFDPSSLLSQMDARAFLGQEPALGAVRRSLKAAFGTGQATLAVIQGPAGSGRTRLLQRASELAAQSRVDVRVLYADCRPQDDGPYAPFSRILRDRFGIAPASSPTIVRGQMATVVSEALDSREAARVAETTHLLGHVAGVPFPDSPFLRAMADEPWKLHQSAAAAVRRFVEGDCANRPLVILLDNMERAENAAWEMLEVLLLSQGPVAFLVAGDEPAGELSAQMGALGGVEREKLAPLQRAHVETCVKQLVPSLVSVPEPFVSALMHRSSGNPGRLLELLSALREAGAFVEGPEGTSVDLKRLEQGQLPLSMDDAIRARLAALPSFERRVMRYAAVVGERFWQGALLALVRAESEGPAPAANDPLKVWADTSDESRLSEALQRLREARFVVEIAQSDTPGHAEYTFQVPGARKLLYQDLDADVRRRCHGVVAEWLALSQGLPVEDLSAVLAAQLERAGLEQRAALVYMDAAAEARRNMRTTMGLRYVDRALSLLDRDNIKTGIEAQHLRGSLLTVLGRYDEGHNAFGELLRLSWRVGARGSAGAALNRIARIHRQRGENKLALDHLKGALVLFRAANDQPGLASTFDDMAQVHRLRGDMDQALAAAKEGLEIRVREKDRRGQAVSLNTIGHIQLDCGEFTTAEARFETALRIRKTIGDHEGEVQSRIALGRLAYHRGQLDEAIHAYERALEVSREMDNHRFQSYLLGHLGEAYLGSDRLDEAQEALNEAKTMADAMRDRRLLADIERSRGLLALRGGSDRASEILEGALEQATRYGTREALALAHRGIGRLRARTLFDATGRGERHAEQSFRESIRVFQECGNRHQVARTQAELGYHLLERGEPDAAREALRRAHRTMRALELPEGARVERTLAEL